MAGQNRFCARGSLAEQKGVSGSRRYQICCTNGHRTQAQFLARRIAQNGFAEAGKVKDMVRERDTSQGSSSGTAEESGSGGHPVAE